VKKYKLIKTYPGMIYDPDNLIFSTNPDRANYPEFWKEIKEPQFKIGDWIYCGSGWDRPVRKVEKIVDDNLIVTETLYGEDFSSFIRTYPAKNFRLATTEEIETHLIAEAKERGYITGTVINSIPTVASLFKWVVNCDAGYRYYPDEDRLDCMRTERDVNCTIYHRGQWAGITKEEPIMIAGYKAEYDSLYDKGFHNYSFYRGGQWAEIVKEEPIKIGGFTTKIENNMFWVGCRSFSFEKIKELYSIMSYFGIEQISISDTKIVPSIVKKILDKIDER